MPTFFRATSEMHPGTLSNSKQKATQRRVSARGLCGQHDPCQLKSFGALPLAQVRAKGEDRDLQTCVQQVKVAPPNFTNNTEIWQAVKQESKDCCHPQSTTRAAGAEICKTLVGNGVFVFYQSQAEQITTDMYTTTLNVRGVRPDFLRW